MISNLEQDDLDPPTHALVRLAVAIAFADPEITTDCARMAMASGMPLAWGDELILQSVLMVGWPRALVAAEVWRDESGREATAEQLQTGAEPSQWLEQGEQLCRKIYGRNYERLRANVKALHPALDDWMVRHGYGRTLSRPGLDLIRRELCTVAQTVVLVTPIQFHSHLRGALNVGASIEAIDATLDEVAELIPEMPLEWVDMIWDPLRDRLSGDR